MIASTLNAAGLGKLVVLSAMGEPFRAEIDLLPDGDERSPLMPRLASPEFYQRADFRYNPALAATRFNMRRQPDGHHVINVVSAQPLNEPFVYLLVEIDASTTRIVRAYTALLDPPGYRAPQAVSAVEYLPALVAAPVVKPAVAPAADHIKTVARPVSRQERLSDVDAKTLAAMFERVAALEASVAQLQRQWEKPAMVAAVQASDEVQSAHNPLVVKVSPVAAPSPPVLQQAPARPVEPMRRRVSKQDSILNNALLVLAIGLLILLGGLVYVMWGRPVMRERRARGKG